MLAELLKVAFRILLFRAGPEDFPYAEDGRWDRLAAGIGIGSTTVLFGLTQPLPLALLEGIVATAVVGVYARLVLRLRGLEARHAQTRNALLTCGGLLLAAMAVPLAAILPHVTAYLDALVEAQRVAATGAEPTLPPVTTLTDAPMIHRTLLDVLGLWFIAVQTRILGRATGVPGLFALFMALLMIGNVIVAMVLVGNFLASLFG